ncbi:MAG: FtsH protease activity modulator HflK [Candidatus Marinimicrobia bacterium]|nr:FtsH protease activity modulator HflK [Candidatus Neomarinimicrobiota bacterium]|tara:strand:+ start:11680 stop:12648 length:969 start_codon:yes stop_codon:yes gene_type:complete
MSNDININDLLKNSPLKSVKSFILPFFVVFLLLGSIYTVDANENAVVLRLGKYNSTTGPGLHLKLPFIDTVEKVKVDYQYKQEFGFRTLRPGVKTQYSNRGYEGESWMLTGDLKIAEVKWVVQYKIKDAKDYLFNVKNVENTIFDVSEAAVRLMIGDRSFIEVLQAERESVAIEARKYMQELLDSYKCGVSIQLVQLQGVVPPEPVADSFNEVNRAKQEQETLINEAKQAYNQKIFLVEGQAEKIITEANGYAIERTNQAEGDVALFESILLEYNKAPQITKDRLYLETMEYVLSNNKNKIIVDKDIENLVPFLNQKLNGLK